MNKTFIALENFRYANPFKCLCGPQTLNINKKDRLYFLSAPDYNERLGWYIPIQRNQHIRFHMYLNDLQLLYQNNQVCSELDVELAIIYHQYKVDQALDQRDDHLFIKHMQILQDWKEFLPHSISAPREGV
ncbi:hypothetical protein [Halobacillus sp. BBL2006]|uniref:hypothetical protein n=1 Tax=Halobacillus sp. BBL2006 TaxID=1543706 RepID=UPI0005433148|nr:hypothetical protein [Halobacillus sp. BBL2006]KHE67680.1 hypothetical protein LD39_16465 [Halobacillus sp. BBL2006]